MKVRETMLADLFKKYLIQLNLASSEIQKLSIQLLTDCAMVEMSISHALISIHILTLKLKLMQLIEIKENGLRWPLLELQNQESFHLIEQLLSTAVKFGTLHQSLFQLHLQILRQEPKVLPI